MKKIYIGSGIAIVLSLVIYLFFLYTQSTDILREWVQSHVVYTIIFFLSIPARYVSSNNKGSIYTFLRISSIGINTFILGSILFTNNIGLGNKQFILLSILIGIGIGSIYIKHRIRYIIMSIVGISSIVLCSIHILPMYETIPNISDFVSSQKTTILNKGTKEGMLIIKNSLEKKEIANVLGKNIEIPMFEKTHITFASKTTENQEKLFISLGNGGFVQIPEQSIITIEKKGNVHKMEILQGKIEYFIPKEYSGSLVFIGKNKGVPIETIENNIRSVLIQDFETQKKAFLIEQLGGNILLNPTINRIIKFFITTLYTIQPTVYEKNMLNYQYIQKYFDIQSEVSGQNLTGENIQNIVQDMLYQAKKGNEKTMILKKIFK